MQNKLVIALLLTSVANVQAAGPPTAFTLPNEKKGAQALADGAKTEGKPMVPSVAGVPPPIELSKEIKKIMVPGSVADMPIPAAPTFKASSSTSKIEAKPKSEKEAKKIEKQKKADVEEAKAKEGAASKLLPETVKDGNKDEKSGTPLLTDNDARCYAARFSDLKGAAALTHYATVGVN